MHTPPYKLRELDLAFMNELFPKPEYSWDIQVKKLGDSDAYAVMVESSKGSCTSHAFTLEDVPGAAQRAKEYLNRLPYDIKN